MNCPHPTNPDTISVFTLPILDIQSLDDTLTLTLNNGSPDWVYDLLEYDELGNVTVQEDTVSTQSTTLPINPNHYYEITNVEILGEDCPNIDTIPVGHIDGLSLIHI